MARVPAKIIERILKKEGIEIDGYDVLEGLYCESAEAAKLEGMDDGITQQYDFLGKLEYENFSLEFDCSMLEDFREMHEELIPYYYLHVGSCKVVRKDFEDVLVEIDVFEK